MHLFIDSFRYYLSVQFWGTQLNAQIVVVRFRTKAIRCEAANLGNMIDLVKLEKECTTEKDDTAAAKKESATVVRRKGSGTHIVRVAQRAEPLQSARSRLKRERTKNSMLHKECQLETNKAPRVKKQTPSIQGLVIGNEHAQYEDSNISLPVQGCSTTISVCKQLAGLLKKHQIEGIQFCWKNVCSNLLTYQEEKAGSVYGAILAHNMVRQSQTGKSRNFLRLTTISMFSGLGEELAGGLPFAHIVDPPSTRYSIFHWAWALALQASHSQGSANCPSEHTGKCAQVDNDQLLITFYLSPTPHLRPTGSPSSRSGLA